MASEDGSLKLPLKILEISLSKYYDEAIPHHLRVLKVHKLNIIKYQETGELNKIKHEQINAKRQVTQLKTLLRELEEIRSKVLPKDLAKFDALTHTSRKKTLQAIIEYLDNPPSIEIPKKLNTENQYIDTNASTDSIGHLLPSNIQLKVDNQDLLILQEKEDCLKTWEELNREVQDLYDVFVKLQQTIDCQSDNVQVIHDNVAITADHVSAGTQSLARAEKLKLTFYPVAGAVIGCCIAGPIGLIAGVKVAGAALLGGGLIGFTGGNMIKKQRDLELKTMEEEQKKDD